MTEIEHAIEDYKLAILTMEMKHPSLCMTKPEVYEDFFEAVNILNPYCDDIGDEVLEELELTHWF